MEKTILTEAEAKIVARGLNNTLTDIMYDMLGGDESATIPQAEVIEIVLDADYLETNGMRLFGKKSGPEYDAVKKFRTLPYKEQCKFAKTVFPYKRYGL